MNTDELAEEYEELYWGAVVEAWKRLEVVMLKVEGEWTGNGYMVRKFPIEEAVADVRDALTKAGFIEPPDDF
jgi:hypothetical protein